MLKSSVLLGAHWTKERIFRSGIGHAILSYFFPVPCFSYPFIVVIKTKAGQGKLQPIRRARIGGHTWRDGTKVGVIEVLISSSSFGQVHSLNCTPRNCTLNYIFPWYGNQQRTLSKWASTLAAHLESPEKGKEEPRLGLRSQGLIQLAWGCTSAS